MKLQLSVDEQQRRSDIYHVLTDAAQALDEAVIKTNTQIASARHQLQTAVDAYNEALERARQWAVGIGLGIDHDLTLLPESDRKTYAACAAWARKFLDADFDQVAFDFPDRVVVEAEDHPQLLLDLPARAAVNFETLKKLHEEQPEQHVE